MSRKILVALVVIGVVVVAGLSWVAYRMGQPQPVASSATSSTQALIGGPFTLVDQDGETRTEEAFLGRPTLVYFGYTYCPDVCPTELQKMVQALDLMGEEGEQVQPVFISVDPERDTVEQMKSYVSAFHPRLVGLTGTSEQVDQAAKAYRVFYRKASDDGSTDYLMDHSSIIFLMDEDGNYLTHFGPDSTSQSMAQSISNKL